MERITPILHLTDRCNLQCDYCYVYKNNNSKILCKNNLDRIVSALKKIITYNAPKRTKIILHGGEPLTVSKSVLNEFFSQIKAIDDKVVFSMQTNLTLLDKDFCDLFKKYDVHIGFSLDGCNAEQNKYRRDSHGNSSFEKVMDRYRFAIDENVFPGAIVTVNKANIGGEKLLIEFINKNKIKCDIRPAFPTNDNSICMTPTEYATFICNIFDLWLTNENYDTFLVSNFESEIREIIGGTKECKGCSKSENCGNHFISIDADGECYPCNRLYGIEDFYLGNLFEVSLEDILLNSKKITSKRWSALKKSECFNCEIAEYCHGGCPAIAYFAYHDYNSKDYFCESYRKIRGHIKERIKE